SVILLSALLFVAVFIIAGLDYRFQWFHLPFGVSLAASIVFLIGYGLYGEVMRENAYLSRTVEVQENQKVIDTGLYSIVRHPMYFSTVLLFVSMPLVLGSLYAFLLMLCGYPLLIAWRIQDEEKTLLDGLAGYREYTGKVKYKLLPFIW
ncbi:MAG: isoprenylcysteine carboxylmethyltransferase family protein, partial [Gemmiger sp.]|nr:isoprenylcysteine carboxylmethyltransferase family protein [Gemmiger sp.]